MFLATALFRQRQPHGCRRHFTGLRNDLDGAAMGGDDPAADGQAEAAAFDGVGGVAAKKGLEKPRLLVGRNPRADVREADEQRRTAAMQVEDRVRARVRARLIA